MRPIRIFIADDHALLRAGLRRIIDSQPDMEVVGEASDSQQTVALVAGTRPTLVLLDVAMPGNGLAALRTLRERWPAIKVVVVTMFDDHAHLRLALDGGASGYVIKSASAEELVGAIRTVHGGRTYTSPCLDNGAILAGDGGEAEGMRRRPALTAREREVVRLVARGHSAREAAAKLGLSVKTVEAYRSKVMEKLGLESRAELVSYALAEGLLLPGSDDHAG